MTIKNELPELAKHVEAMIDKAAAAAKSEDALRFSQAALNAANAMCCLTSGHE